MEFWRGGMDRAGRSSPLFSWITKAKRYWGHAALASACLALGWLLGLLTSISYTSEQIDTGLGRPDIGEIIYDIQDDLARFGARRVREDMPKLFSAKSMEVELSFVVKRDVKAGGRVEYKPVLVESGATYAKEQVQREKLMLEAAEPGIQITPPSARKDFPKPTTPLPQIPARKGVLQ